ncbi:MAG: pentapeptide repeat-containing protein [Acidobacteriota bacterium]
MSAALLLEPDFALRWALWRLCRLAVGADPLAGSADRLRFAVYEDELGIGWLELTILDREGAVLERAFCEEEVLLPLNEDALRRVLSRVDELRAAGETAPFRWVRDVRLLAVEGDARTVDLMSPGDREWLWTTLGLGEPPPSMIWDLGSHESGETTSRVLLTLATVESDPRPLFDDLYESLRARLGDRLPERTREMMRNLRFFLFGRPLQREPTLRESAMSVGWWLELLGGARSEMPAAVVELLADEAQRGLFHDTVVTLESIYVAQQGSAVWPDADGKLSRAAQGRAMGLVLRWMSLPEDERRAPFLVLGAFGSGKSSLLRSLAREMTTLVGAPVPLLIPLRELREVSERESLQAVLLRFVRERWELALETPGSRRYCLLCDGFDELELYFRGLSLDRWVDDGFRSLQTLAMRPDLDLVISSRPVLLMDVTRSRFLGGACGRLDLELFERPEIALWCTRYRRAAGLDSFLTLQALEERELYEVARTPLVLYMIARMVEHEDKVFSEPRPYSKTEVYRRFIDWTERGGYLADDPKHVVPERIREMLQAIGWLFYRSGDTFLPEDELLESLRSRFGFRVERVPVDRNILVTHMLQPARHAADRPRRGHLVEFTHQSFREYLAAEWIWRGLSSAIEGEGLDRVFWHLLGNRPLPAAETGFLLEMVDELPWPRASALFEALEGTENVNLYWSRWMLDEPDGAGSADPDARIEPLASRVATALGRACALGVLGFLLRARAQARLRRLSSERRDDAPDPLDATDLDRLLHLTRVLPGQGVGGDSRRLLLDHLEGVALAGSALDGHQLEKPNLRRALLRGLNFSFSRWLDADLRGADLTDTTFQHSLVTVAASRGASFAEATLNDITLTHPESASIEDVDFTAASFYRARFLDVTFVGCRFSDNDWRGAHRGFSTTERPSIVRDSCLDAAAHRFFTAAGFVVERCRVAE